MALAFSEPRDVLVGWYELGPRQKVLVTWAPDSTELRILDFDAAQFHRLTPDGDSAWLWRRGADSLNRRVQFTSDPHGRITGFRWSGADSSGHAGRALEFPFDQELVRFRNDSVELTGVLLTPRIRKFVGRPGAMREVPITVPGAVMIHGSGSSDRDNVWAFHIAQSLARRDIAVLLPDKRGSGASGGDWRTATFEDLAADARAAARLLADHPKVDDDRLGYVGLSQGGWIAPLAATGQNAEFVVSVSSAAVTPAEQVRFEITQDLRRAGVSDSSSARVLELFDRAMDFSRALAEPEWIRFKALRDTLSSGPLRDAVAPFPGSRDHWQWGWWNGIGDFDPVPHWHGTGARTLVVYGARDAEDNVPVSRSVERLRDALHPELRHENAIRVYEGLGHALVDPGTGWVSRTFLEELADWIRATSQSDQPSSESGRNQSLTVRHRRP